MSSENIIIALIVVVAVIGAFFGMGEDAAIQGTYVALALLVLGLVTGFMNPASDMAERTGMLVLAVALPYVANNLGNDAIGLGMLGDSLDHILDNIAVGIAGMYLANFTTALIGRIKPA
jgi:hypothetical protein